MTQRATCPKCSAPILVADDISKVTCQTCKSVLQLRRRAADVPAAAPDPPAPPPRHTDEPIRTPDIDRPQAVTIHEPIHAGMMMGFGFMMAIVIAALVVSTALAALWVLLFILVDLAQR